MSLIFLLVVCPINRVDMGARFNPSVFQDKNQTWLVVTTIHLGYYPYDWNMM